MGEDRGKRPYNVIVRHLDRAPGEALVDTRVEAVSEDEAVTIAEGMALAQGHRVRVLGVSRGHEVSGDGFWSTYSEGKGGLEHGSK